MKLKELLYGLGMRPALREYPSEIRRIELARDGTIDFARWMHPSAERRYRAGGGARITQSMVDALRGFLQPGDVAIDIGAHSGDSTVPIALAVGSKGAVLAFEPNVHAYKVLEINAGLNQDRTHIIPLNYAATPEDGTFEFEYSDPGFCNGGHHPGISRWRHAHFFALRVEGRNLPRLLEQRFPDLVERIRYIKIDTEGFDREVAASLRPILESRRPFLKTEMYKHTPEPMRRGYYQDLRALGYRMYKVESEETDYRGTPLGEDDLMQWSHFDVFAEPE